MVSHVGQTTIATTLRPAKPTHTASSHLCRSQAITRISDRLDRRLRAELLAQPPHADVDNVRTGIEVIAPHLGEQPLAADHLAGVTSELVEELELAVGEVGDLRPDPGLA